MSGSALYTGVVVHNRTTPRRHFLRYRVVSLLLDLDELDALATRLRLFSHNRFNLFSFYDRDHGAAADQPLRRGLEQKLREAGLPNEGGRIRVLCMPRVLGKAFNPLTVFFCEDAAGALSAILYEVRNTFGERHTYLLPATTTHGVITQSCAKRFYVSPFLDMDLGYHFRITPPGETVAIAIEVVGPNGPIMTAQLAGRRKPLTDRALLSSFRRAPMQCASVLAGIHWEALKLWRKGLPLQSRPKPHARSVTIVPAGSKP